MSEPTLTKHLSHIQRLELAHKFAVLLDGYARKDSRLVGGVQLKQGEGLKLIRERNRLDRLEDEASQNCCSHDYCDANQVFIDAFEEVFKTELGFDGEDEDESFAIHEVWEMVTK